MHSPSPVPVPAPPGTQLRGDRNRNRDRDRDSDGGTPSCIGVKHEMESDHKPVTITKRTKKTKGEVKPKASGSGSGSTLKTEDVIPKRGSKKPGRKPGVSYDSKKWSGSELEALFFAGLGSNGSVPSARFHDTVQGRSVSQCANAWR